jgi:multiple sugar transport system permease protein
MSVVAGTQVAAPVGRGYGRLRALDRGGLALSLAALVAAVVWAFPLYWTVGSSLVMAPTADASSPAEAIELYRRVIFDSDLGRWYLNSLVTSAGVTVGVLSISAACGYAISQIRFHGRRVLWFLILASFMIPI